MLSKTISTNLSASFFVSSAASATSSTSSALVMHHLRWQDTALEGLPLRLEYKICSGEGCRRVHYQKTTHRGKDKLSRYSSLRGGQIAPPFLSLGFPFIFLGPSRPWQFSFFFRGRLLYRCAVLLCSRFFNGIVVRFGFLHRLRFRFSCFLFNPAKPEISEFTQRSHSAAGLRGVNLGIDDGFIVLANRPSRQSDLLAVAVDP